MRYTFATFLHDKVYLTPYARKPWTYHEIIFILIHEPTQMALVDQTELKSKAVITHVMVSGQYCRAINGTTKYFSYNSTLFC